MQEKTEIVEKTKTSPPATIEKERTLAIDVAMEMSNGYDLVIDIINKLNSDTRVEEITSDDGDIIGQKTHIHPQLLSWVREARMFRNDLWKMGGGEIQQEAEKEKIKLQAKMLMEIIKTNPKDRDEAFDAWKRNVKINERS